MEDSSDSVSDGDQRPPRAAGRGRGARARGRAPQRGRGRGRGGPRPRRAAPAAAAAAVVSDDEDWDEVGEDTELPPAHRFIPNKPPGLQANLNDESSVIDCFSELFNDAILDSLRKTINEYAAAKITQNLPARKKSIAYNWTPITKSEVCKLLAVLIAMGITKKPSIKSYWSTDSVLETRWYASMFTRDRFEAIYHTMLHASEAGAQGKDKIEPFLLQLIENFQGAFYPFQDLAIDEMVIGYKGTWANKQYNASKPSKYHIKTFGLCDSITGYVYNILTYFGKNTSYNPALDKDSGEAVKVFEYLLQNVGSGHHVFADRYYTTLKLLNHLKGKRLYYTGTVQTNRVGFPKVIRKKTLKLQHRESKVFRSKDGGHLTVAWRDKKANKYVIVTTSKSNAKPIEVRRRRETLTMPTLIHQYNKCMNGCDRLDQSVSYYCQYNRKTIKWWKRIFLWLLEVTQVNSFILYQLSHPDQKLTLLQFKKHLISQLCLKATEYRDYVPPSVSKRGRPYEVPTFNRLSQAPHLVELRPMDRNCEVCSTPANRKRTNYGCITCGTFLHPKDCFRIYHTQVEYK